MLTFYCTPCLWTAVIKSVKNFCAIYYLENTVTKFAWLKNDNYYYNVLVQTKVAVKEKEQFVDFLQKQLEETKENYQIEVRTCSVYPYH